MQHKSAIIIGDSFNNTLGLIRSLGQAGVKVILLLVGGDRLFVSKSRFVNHTIRLESMAKCERILQNLSAIHKGAFLICSNDKAAKWIDDNEEWLSKHFITPMRGKHIGNLFYKPQQCSLAEKFGIRVPKSIVFDVGESFPHDVQFPLLMKPANSNEGEKSDIHICKDINDVANALKEDSICRLFIVQEYIEKDFEINMIGVSTDDGVAIPGGIKKLRHYPTIYSPCSFGIFLSPMQLNIDTNPIKRMIDSIGYRGPFSVEFLRKGDKSYFMEVNFRHDGLAYTATAAGANLLDMYVSGKISAFKIKKTFMMDLSTDYCHVKDGNLSRSRWLKDFIRTRCQLNFNWRDPIPTLAYYRAKFRRLATR